MDNLIKHVNNKVIEKCQAVYNLVKVKHVCSTFPKNIAHEQSHFYHIIYIKSLAETFIKLELNFISRLKFPTITRS